MIRRAFLDMDGVIADFIGAICKFHNKQTPYSDPASLGIFDTEKLWGISSEEFWAPVAKDSQAFWEGIEKTPEADGIVTLAAREFGLENVCILTAPSKDIGSVPGKKEWIKRHYPALTKRMIFATASAKRLMAGTGKYLIDDKDSNVDEFDEAGGVGILVPRPWNAEHMLEPRLLEVVKEQIKEGKRHGW